MTNTVILHKKAKDVLDYLKRKNPDIYDTLIAHLKDIQIKGLRTLNTKDIGSAVYRKRVGRWRILFTIDGDTFHVWIIDQEKDMKKDYTRWKQYIVDMLKMMK